MGTWSGNSGFAGKIVVYYSTWDSSTLTALSEEPAKAWQAGEEVVPETAAIEKFRALYIRGTDTADGWMGKLEASVDDGATWMFLHCISCEHESANKASSQSGMMVVVDGNTDTGFDSDLETHCLDGNYCAFVLPTYLGILTPPSSKKCAGASDCEFKGVNAGA